MIPDGSDCGGNDVSVWRTMSILRQSFDAIETQVVFGRKKDVGGGRGRGGGKGGEQ